MRLSRGRLRILLLLVTLAAGRNSALVAVEGPGSRARAARAPEPRSPVASGAPQSSEPQSVRLELPNGLRVWLQEDHRRPVVRVETLYKVGWINEGPGITGVAHYVEHMAFRATENIRNEDIYGFIDRIGGRWTGGTGQTETSYAETVPSWALEEVLRIEAERMSRVAFDPTEFERERSNVITESNRYVPTEPLEILGDELLAASFAIHPYRYGSGTWARDNLVLTRDQAYDFYRRYYGPDNAVLAVVGDVAIGEARALVEEHFGPLEPADRSGEVLLVEPPQRTEKSVTLASPSATEHLAIAYRAPQATHPDYPVLAVLDRVLGTEGRLQSAVAEAGGIEVSTSFRATPYPYVYRISASAEPSADLERLLTAIQREIDRLGSEGITEAELEAARAEVRQVRRNGAEGGRGIGPGASQSSSLPPSDPRESITRIASRLTGAETFPWEVSPERLDEIRRAEEQVTSADIEAYVDRWLRPSQRTTGFLVAGDSDIVSQWTDGRPTVGGRLEIPPMTVPPAERMRPDPVPARALEPLPDSGIATGRRQLANGIVVRAARRDGPAEVGLGRATAALQVRISLDNDDPAGKEGLSLLVARLIASDPELLELVERTGAELSDTAHGSPTEAANTGHVDLRLRFLASDTAAMIEAVAGALRPGTIPPERIDAERAMLLEEVREERAEPGGIEERARNHVLREVAAAWNLGIPAIPETLSVITTEDVNEHLSRFLAGGALTVSLVGPDDPGALLDLGAAAFGDHPGGIPSGSAAGVESRDSGRGSRTSETPDAPREQRIPLASEFQVTVVAGLPGLPRGHPDTEALALLNYIVGMPYYGGRLGWALTKSGLTYSSEAATTFGRAAGHVLMSTVCDTNNLEATLQAIREVVEGIAADGVEEWELKEAQASALGRMVLYGPGPESDEQTLATALLDSETFGVEILDYPERSRAILAVTYERINATARRYYRPELLSVVAIGALPADPGTSPFPAGTFRDLFMR